MNVPAVAKRTFEKFKNDPMMTGIIAEVLDQLKRMTGHFARARFVHRLVDQYNQEVFTHPTVQKMISCQKGCGACCHTQVSVTEDEAILLAERIRQGIQIDFNRLTVQKNAENNSAEFYKIPYNVRKCVFLDEQNSCSVYEDRPSVCRTNAVIGGASQCSTEDGKEKAVHLINTYKSDLVIVSHFASSLDSGALPFMLWKALQKIDDIRKKENNIQKSLKSMLHYVSKDKIL